MLEIVVYILQVLLALGAFFISFILLRKNRAYLGNQLLALSLGLVGVYAILLFLYKVLDSVALMYYSIAIGFSALLFAVFFLYCTIQVMLYSSRVIWAKPARFALLFLVALVITVLMQVMDWIYVEGDDLATLDYNPAIFYPFAAYIGGLLIYTLVNLYMAGIRKADAVTKHYLALFFAGLTLMLLALVTEGVGGAFEGLADLFDILLFSFLSAGVWFMAASLLRKSS